MQKIAWSERFWGEGSRFVYLFVAAIVLLFTLLGSREIWTQEHRWADIVFNMLYHHDYLHPSLDGNDYYDKPLLSYWLIAALALVSGKLTLWVMRIPSALAGLLAIWSIYRLGTHLKDKRFGLLAGWLLLTTFYFVFWARTASADMLNLAGTLFAVTWYFITKDKLNFLNYAIFFFILAVTALCKGLVGPAVALLAILPDLVIDNSWRKHLRLSFFLALIPAAIVYVLPFSLSAHFGQAGYQENGLYLVYRENILRYFQPFDHKDPIYTYLLYLPIYTLPWAFFLLPALGSLKSRWQQLSWHSKWMAWSVLLLFLFFTFSGSRRSYYILPMVPFAILLTADWIQAGAKRNLWAGRVALIFFLFLFIDFDLVQPWYYSRDSLESFAVQVQATASKIKPWSEWQVIMLDPESKIRFYLALPPEIKNYSVQGTREAQTHATLVKAWPVLKNKPKNTIFITRLIYVPLVQSDFKNYDKVIINNTMQNAPVAFIPKQ